MQRTKSEALFEAFCQQANVPCRRIPTDRRPTPDYELECGGERIIAEVKQLDPTPSDLEREKLISAGVVQAYGDEPGRRVRLQIDSAKTQLKRQTGGAVPGILVLFNNIPTRDVLTDPMFVMIAMYGQIGVPVEAPVDPAVRPTFGPLRHLGKRRMTPVHNTSVSAVCVLQGVENGEIRLTFYHNCFATRPFDPEWLRRPTVLHYSARQDESSAFSFWDAV